MADETLVSDQILQGYEFLHRLARAGWDVSVAFWARRHQDVLWTLWLGYADFQADGVGAFLDASTAAQGLPEIVPAFLRMVKDTDPPVALAKRLRDRSAARFHFTVGPSSLREVDLYEAVIYPKIGKMNTGDVAVALAHEMNRTGESHPVTLTLADGAEVRGYPLAIRKSAVGGAMVELADADTKGKGADVPLDRIFSVVPDHLTP